MDHTKGPPTPLTPLERYNSQYANSVMLLSRCGTMGRLGDWLKWSGFAIGYAALVSMALFGAFMSRAEIITVDILTAKVFIVLLVRAMLTYQLRLPTGI
ncbi:hypothetical protein CTI12_AA094080 [Artemisia annua]|uniref:H(+)-exporting diphosphatase n=1 Tax=Artemisia annua TaxID=35608 RepID=A0A2U1PZ89_ARTAN|nr:hypothetical protein CTI12_AA094080 [Artemisia annua]